MSKITIALVIGILFFSANVHANPNPTYQPVQFKGGTEALQSFIAKHLVYPEECRAEAIEGGVKVKLHINAFGEIINCEIIEGLDDACNEEVKRVVSLMPKWKPATFKGHHVPSGVLLNFSFRLKS